MRLLHISDLHIGKKVKGYSLITDQLYVLEQVLNVAKERKVDGIIIAGDIYDSSNPSSEAISYFDRFISDIHSLGIACYAVSGNHDSVYRVSFGSDIMAEENVFFAKKYSGKIEPINADKDTQIWLIPFIRPVDVREYHPDFAVGSYEEMMQSVIKNMDINKKKTNILVAHQFITHSGKEPERCESESVSLGTLDNIDVSDFQDFDYVALGHLHRPQAIGRDTVRYSGSLLKYSFSEKDDKKSMVLIETSGKKIKTELIPFKLLRDMKEFTGTYQELLKYPETEDYARIILKDKDFITDVRHRLESKFKNIMTIEYENLYTQKNNVIDNAVLPETKTPEELFDIFYELQNNQKLNKEKSEIVKEVFENIEGDE